MRLWATWVRGHWAGVLVPTYHCIIYRHIKAVWHVGEAERTLDPHTFCFSSLTWHLAPSWLNWQLLWSTKCPCVIPLLVSKPAPVSRLVNSTCEHEAKQDVCCQSGGSRVENPGKVIQWEEARRGEEEEEKGERWVRSIEGILYAKILH